MKFIRKYSIPGLIKAGIFLEVKKLMGFKPLDISIYKMAFTHRSLNLKNSSGVAINYERFEFLGDAMLDAVISNYFMTKFLKEMKDILQKCGRKLLAENILMS